MSMVKQTRHLFDTCDVLQLRLVCGFRDEKTERPCDGEVLYQFGAHKIDRDWRCPKCGESWLESFSSQMPPEMKQRSPQEAASLKLIEALDTLAETNGSRFKIRFEIDAESD